MLPAVFDKKYFDCSNGLVEGRFDLNLVELRALAFILSRIDGRKEDSNGTPVARLEKLDVSLQGYVDLLKTCGLFSDNNEAWQNLQAGIEGLYQKSLKIKSPEENVLIEGRWISYKELHKEQKYYTISLSHFLLPHVTQLESRFTKLYIEATLQFSSVYTTRLYQLLIKDEWKPGKVKTSEYSLRELLEILQCPPSLYEYKNFKSRVIKPALKVFEKENLIKIELREWKIDRKVVSLTFKYEILDYKKFKFGGKKCAA